jgi:hypothetical protein
MHARLIARNDVQSNRHDAGGLAEKDLIASRTHQTAARTLDSPMTAHYPSIPTKRFAELVTERTVERFLLRFFLRESRMRNLCVVAPFVSTLHASRFGLKDLRDKVERERIPTYVITREPIERYQQEAMDVIKGSPWIEVRYNSSIHAKLYVATAEREADSFALFGSGNLTTQSIESNIELAMLVYGEGAGRELLHQLHYWANVRLRTLHESRLVQSIKAKRN